MPYNPYGNVRRGISTSTKPETVVEMIHDDHPALSRNLLRDLQAERAKHYEGLISAKDWADFEKRRGLLHGIEAAIALCVEAKEKLEA
jgi:hypothetical protein